jgi:ATP-dependent helicase HrpB
VPPALLDAGLAGAREIWVLEPRRIAARAAADFVARERGRPLGDEVGYRVRFEQRGGRGTRLWFVTEGVFGRQLVADPFLERAGVVVLDEFHERHLQGDVALAVVRQLQETVRPDLRLVVMSATLDTDALAQALGDATVLTCEGRAHPVAVEYDAADGRPLAARVAGTVARLTRDAGDVLVFLPGAAEIRRAAAALGPLGARQDLDVVPLHGDLSLEAQQRALRAGSRRRVVLATNVAETALTVEGVTAVVDSGLARVARFDARHGINRLRVEPISRAAAEQRAGRAGRTGPGRCIRLWSAAEHAGRRAYETPEVLRLDLARTLLDLHAWGLGDAAGLAWLDPPPPAALARAEGLLATLGALTAEGRVLTPIGRRMLELPTEPRLARLLVEAERAGCPADGALLAALASERDVLGTGTFGTAAPDFPPGPSDLLLRLELYQDAARRRLAPEACRALGLEPGAVRTVERAQRQLARLLGKGTTAADVPTLLRCTLAGFPDRVARRREPGSSRALMVGGSGVALDRSSVVREAELFVAVDLEGGAGVEPRVRIASAVEASWLADLFPDAMRETRELVFDSARGRVVERRRRAYHDLPLAESVETRVDRSAAGIVLAEAVRKDLAAAGVLDDAVRELVDRIRFLSAAMTELDWPADLDVLAEDAVASLCAGRTSLAELREVDVGAAILGLLTHPQRSALAREAPTTYPLPGGRVAPIAYPSGRPPRVAARVQELFGLTTTPRLAAGRVPLVVEILAPSKRPVQITDDLASFWRSGYPEVRRQLRGRYPRHDWPEDPLTAKPRSRPGRR